jgi:hypothetical protein
MPIAQTGVTACDYESTKLGTPFAPAYAESTPIHATSSEAP